MFISIVVICPMQCKKKVVVLTQWLQQLHVGDNAITYDVEEIAHASYNINWTSKYSIL